MEDVAEAVERRVAVVAVSLAGVLGDVERERAVGAEEAEEVDVEPVGWAVRTAGALGLIAVNGRGGEGERGGLAEADGVFLRARGRADAGSACAQGIKPANDLEEVEGVRPLEKPEL